jgi:Fe-S-cluster containining protein
MKIAAAELRMQYVLPSKLLAKYALMRLVEVVVMPAAYGLPWWQAEQHIILTFIPSEAKPLPADSQYDQREDLGKTCSSCGQCCTRLPDHQIAIYMTRMERARAEMAGFPIWEGVSGVIRIDDCKFDVLRTKENGDCHFLGSQGCTLGDHKPLWCKLYYCEKHYGGHYPFETVVPPPVLPSAKRSEPQTDETGSS